MYIFFNISLDIIMYQLVNLLRAEILIPTRDYSYLDLQQLSERNGTSWPAVYSVMASKY